MNLLDLGILVLLALITLRGYFRGLFQELAVLVGVVGGVLVAAHTFQPLAEKLKGLVQNPQWARILAFALIFLIIYWLTRLAAYVLQRLLYHLYLDVLDRLFGAFFALVKGVLILGFALMLVGVVMPKDSPLLKQSLAAPWLVGVSKQALGYLPPDFKQRLQEYLKQYQRPERPQRSESRPKTPGVPVSAHNTLI
jgi:membrane protein required for colicin V production